MTFSLLGRCARTGMFGAAVTTSSIGVGSRCPVAKAGNGACLTQARTDPRLGPLAVDLLAQGFPARQVMDAVIALAPHREWRQLAVIDREGRTAAFTGDRVAGETAGEAHGTDCVAIANIVRSSQIPVAMVQAFEKEPDSPLPLRLLKALLAGDAAGGEFVPLVSAALLVVHRERFPYVNLRVDSHLAPITDLMRLWHEYEPEADLWSRGQSIPVPHSPRRLKATRQERRNTRRRAKACGFAPSGSTREASRPWHPAAANARL